jgi:hypothetical protein
MTFNGAAPTRTLTTSPSRYAGQDNGWVLSLIEPVILDFDKSIMKYPSAQHSRAQQLSQLARIHLVTLAAFLL